MTISAASRQSRRKCSFHLQVIAAVFRFPVLQRGLAAGRAGIRVECSRGKEQSGAARCADFCSRVHAESSGRKLIGIECTPRHT